MERVVLIIVPCLNMAVVLTELLLLKALILRVVQVFVCKVDMDVVQMEEKKRKVQTTRVVLKIVQGTSLDVAQMMSHQQEDHKGRDAPATARCQHLVAVLIR